MNHNQGNSQFRFEATGSIAHNRLVPLLPSDWVDVTDGDGDEIPDFLWENSQQLKTKKYRDDVKAYSHLPNGTSILDSKWVLGRLLSQGSKSNDPLLATLETHCFRGINGFERFCQQTKMFDQSNGDDDEQSSKSSARYPDILNEEEIESDSENLPTAPKNFWVVKDAMSNGAGGVWVVSPKNAESFISQDTTPLYPEHAYVAQKYVWPPVLFGGRKCHVRVYGLLTSDGKAFVHKRAFLHVANDIFTTTDVGTTGRFQDSVHITNCCANSHDDSKFAGEILADFEQTAATERDGQNVVPLARFFPSIKSCVAALAEKTFPFLQGGRANGGFEYMGMDFMLSYNEHKQPVAYILEVNAPPSQDTATGLPHAENLHDDVIRDLIAMWVIPRVSGEPGNPGGWRCVYDEGKLPVEPGSLIVPSKASIINKIRWAMFEKKAARAEKENRTITGDNTGNGTPEKTRPKQLECETIVRFARSQFPYFSDSYVHRQNLVFFENAGGSQVAQPVIDAVTASLSFRHRDVVGDKTKDYARETLRRLLGAKNDPIFVGPNASSLITSLAQKYVEFGLLTSDDEIVVSTESHTANFDPWVKAAKVSGASIRYWAPFSRTITDRHTSKNLVDLISSRTRIVAIPHASNVLGQIRDVKKLSQIIKEKSKGHAHVVVDGVASAPHSFSNVEELMVDWYVVSCHKLFSSHLGGLYGRRSGPVELFFSAAGLCSGSDKSLFKYLEIGTVNYEACAGVVGLGVYFKSLSESIYQARGIARINTEDGMRHRVSSTGEACSETGVESTRLFYLNDLPELSRENVEQAYHCIRVAEYPLVETLLKGLKRSGRVRIIEGDIGQLECVTRLPIACFVHEKIGVRQIVSFCEENGYICRASSFLCTEYLAKEFDFDHSEGVVRVSLAHYNTVEEVDALIRTLESHPMWF